MPRSKPYSINSEWETTPSRRSQFIASRFSPANKEIQTSEDPPELSKPNFAEVPKSEDPPDAVAVPNPNKGFKLNFASPAVPPPRFSAPRPVQFIAHRRTEEADGKLSTFGLQFISDSESQREAPSPDVGVLCPSAFSISPLRKLPFAEARRTPDSDVDTKPVRPLHVPNQERHSTPESTKVLFLNAFSQTPPRRKLPSVENRGAEARGPESNAFSQTPPPRRLPVAVKQGAKARTPVDAELRSLNVFAKTPPRLELIGKPISKPYGLNQEWATPAPSHPSTPSPTCTKKLSAAAPLEPPTSPKMNGASAPTGLNLPLPFIWRLQRFEMWDRTSYGLLTGILWLMAVTIVFIHPHACSFCTFVKPSYLNKRWTAYFACSYVGVTSFICGFVVWLVRYQRGRVWMVWNKGKFFLRILCVLIAVFGDCKFVDWWSLVVSLCMTLSTITLSFLLIIIDDIGLYEATFALSCAAVRSTIGMNIFCWALVGLLAGALMHLKCKTDARLLTRTRAINVLKIWSERIKSKKAQVKIEYRDSGDVDRNTVLSM